MTARHWLGYVTYYSSLEQGCDMTMPENVEHLLHCMQVELCFGTPKYSPQKVLDVLNQRPILPDQEKLVSQKSSKPDSS